MVKKSDRKTSKRQSEKPTPLNRRSNSAGLMMDAMDRLWVILAGAFFVLLPFVVSTSGFESFDLPKNAFLWISTGLLAVVGVFTGRLRIPSPLHKVDILVIISLGYLVSHTLISGRILEARFGLLSAVSVVIVYFIVRTIPWVNVHRGLWLAIAVSISLNAVFTVLQQFDKFPLMAGSGRADASDRLVPAGFIGEVNRGGFLFALVLIILLYFLFNAHSRKPAKLVFSAGLALLIVIGLAFSRTMTSILGLTACLSFWFVFHNWFMIKKEKAPAKKVLAFGLVLVILLTGVIILGYKAGVGDRVERLADFSEMDTWIYASSGRTPLFYLTWKMIQEAPVTGSGLNSFPVEFFKYKTETDTGRNVKLMPQPGAFKEVHNEFLQTWQELGVLGMVLLLLLFLLPLYYGGRAVVDGLDDVDVYWMATLLLGLVFTGITCLAFFPLHLAVTAPFISLVIAQIVNSAGLDPEAGESVAVPVLLLNPAWLRYSLAAGVCLFAFWSIYSGVNTWQVNKRTGMASYILTRSMREQLQPRQKILIVKEALRILEEAGEKGIQLADIHNLKGTAYLLSGRNKESAGSFRESIRYSPSPETYINLATAFLAMGDRDGAVDCLNTARAYDVQNMKVLQMIFHMWGQNIMDREESLDLMRDLDREGILSRKQKRGMLVQMRDRGLISKEEFKDMSARKRSDDE